MSRVASQFDVWGYRLVSGCGLLEVWEIPGWSRWFCPGMSGGR